MGPADARKAKDTYTEKKPPQHNTESALFSSRLPYIRERIGLHHTVFLTFSFLAAFYAAV